MTIVTKRFLLRDFHAGDRAAFLAYHADPRLLAHCGPEEAAPGHAEALLRTFSLWARERPRRNFQLAAVRRGASQTLAGCCGLRRAHIADRSAEFGIELAPEYWGRHGVAIEIAHALINFGFTVLGLREIFGNTINANTRARRLATWFGAAEHQRGSGPVWMRERGWHQTELRITREAWARKAAFRRFRAPLKDGTA